MILVSLALATEHPASADCADQVLHYGSWRATPSQQWDYRAERLTLLGAEHVRDPSHSQFPRIVAAFREAAPTLIFFEGPDRGIGNDADETIRTRGESGYVRFLAHQANVPTRSLEPSPGQQIGLLMGQFPADQVLLFFVLRETARLRERDHLSGPALDSAVSSLLSRSADMARGGGMALPFSDLAGLEAAARRYWPDRDWRSFPANWFAPAAAGTDSGGLFLAAVNRADSTNRDRHMVRQMVDAVRSGERVFAVVGRNHVPMQAPALACALPPRP